jgi:ribosome-associated protein
MQEAVTVNNTQVDTKKIVIECVNAALEKKAKDLVVLKVKDVSSFADYFMICSGGSSRQVQGIVDSVEGRLKKCGFLPLGVEGANSGQWVLIDYGDVVVHVFYEPVREFYDIERLWSDVPVMAVEETVQSISSLSDNM